MNIKFESHNHHTIKILQNEFDELKEKAQITKQFKATSELTIEVSITLVYGPSFLSKVNLSQGHVIEVSLSIADYEMLADTADKQFGIKLGSYLIQRDVWSQKTRGKLNANL